MNKIPHVVMLAAGLWMFSKAAQNTANAVNTTGNGILKMVGAGIAGYGAYALLL